MSKSKNAYLQELYGDASSAPAKKKNLNQPSKSASLDSKYQARVFDEDEDAMPEWRDESEIIAKPKKAARKQPSTSISDHDEFQLIFFLASFGHDFDERFGIAIGFGFVFTQSTK